MSPWLEVIQNMIVFEKWLECVNDFSCIMSTGNTENHIILSSRLRKVPIKGGWTYELVFTYRHFVTLIVYNVQLSNGTVTNYAALPTWFPGGRKIEDIY